MGVVQEREKLTDDGVVSYDIKEVGLSVIGELRNSMSDMHLNWQGEMFVLEHFDNITNYIIEDQGEMIAALSIKSNGLINFIWVEPKHRQQGLAKTLLVHATQTLGLKDICAVASNNMLLEGFLKRLNFNVTIKQYEMMKLI